MSGREIDCLRLAWHQLYELERDLIDSPDPNAIAIAFVHSAMSSLWDCLMFCGGLYEGVDRL